MHRSEGATEVILNLSPPEGTMQVSESWAGLWVCARRTQASCERSGGRDARHNHQERSGSPIWI
jgi:hypothetical protein